MNLYVFYFHPRSLLRPTCPSSPGRTPLFMLKCSRRSVCPNRSPPSRLWVSNLFRSWTCGNSILIQAQVDAIMSIALPRRGHGNPLAGLVLSAPIRVQHSRYFLFPLNPFLSFCCWMGLKVWKGWQVLSQMKVSSLKGECSGGHGME